MEVMDEEKQIYQIGEQHRDSFPFDDLKTFKTKTFYKISQISINWVGRYLTGIQVDYENVLNGGIMSTDWHCTLLMDTKVVFEKKSHKLNFNEYIVRVQALTSELGIQFLGFLTSEGRVLNFGSPQDDKNLKILDLKSPEGQHFNYIRGTMGLMQPLIRSLTFEAVNIPDKRREMKEELRSITYDMNKMILRN